MSEDQEYKRMERRQNMSLHEQIKIFHAIIAIFCLLIGQSAGIAWWASSITHKVSELEHKTNDRYTKTEAIATNEIQDVRIKRNEADIQAVLILLKEMNNKLDKIMTHQIRG